MMAVSGTIKKLIVMLGVDSAQYEKKLTAAEKRAKKFDKVFAGALAGAALAAGALIVKSTMLAARVETLGVVVTKLGESSNYTQKQLDEYEESIKSQGITTKNTLQSMAQMMQAQIDLAHGADLARIAQNNAVIANINSSEAFKRLVTVLQTGNVLMGRSMGLELLFGEAQKKLADKLGKTTEQLSQQEIMQSRLNEVKRAGVAIEGVYEAAMGTAGKTMLSLDRQFEEISLVIGEIFLPVLTEVVSLIYEGAKGINKYIAVGKKLSAQEKKIAKELVRTGGSYKDLVKQVTAIVKAEGRHVYTQEELNKVMGSARESARLTAEGYLIMSDEQLNTLRSTMELEAGYGDLRAESRLLREATKDAASGIQAMGVSTEDLAGYLAKARDRADEAAEKADAFWDALKRGPGIIKRALTAIEEVEWSKLGAEAVNEFMDTAERMLEKRALTPDQFIDTEKIAGALGLAIQAGVEDTPWREIRDTFVEEFGYSTEAAYEAAKMITAPGFDTKLYVDTTLAQQALDTLWANYRMIPIKAIVSYGKLPNVPAPVRVPVPAPPPIRRHVRKHGHQYGGSGIVPPGFPGDSFPVMMTSGERYHVTSPSQTRSEDSKMLGLLQDIVDKETLDEVRLATLIRDAVLAEAE